MPTEEEMETAAEEIKDVIGRNYIESGKPSADFSNLRG